MIKFDYNEFIIEKIKESILRNNKILNELLNNIVNEKEIKTDKINKIKNKVIKKYSHLKEFEILNDKEIKLMKKYLKEYNIYFVDYILNDSPNGWQDICHFDHDDFTICKKIEKSGKNKFSLIENNNGYICMKIECTKENIIETFEEFLKDVIQYIKN